MILVFGKTGQVAIELQRQAPEAARLTALPRAQADLSDPAACAEAIRRIAEAAEFFSFGTNDLNRSNAVRPFFRPRQLLSELFDSSLDVGL